MQSESNNPQPPKNIVLIGFMGCGKSTIGRELSKMLGYPLIDTDTEIRAKEDASIPEIFEKHGEPYFRDCETSCLQSLKDTGTTRHIIATGGGLPMREGNRETLRQLGYVIWLEADIPTILERTSRTNHRPLLQQPNPEVVIGRMLKERSPVYEECAHLKINTAGLDISETAHGILESARYFFAQS